MDAGMAEKIMQLRYGKDGLIGNADDVIFETSDNIAPKISQFYDLSDSELARLSTVVEQYLVTKSDFFSIRNISGLNNRKNITEAICVVDGKGRILYWRE
jgi:hypothetical protein